MVSVVKHSMESSHIATLSALFAYHINTDRLLETDKRQFVWECTL